MKNWSKLWLKIVAKSSCITIRCLDLKCRLPWGVDNVDQSNNKLIGCQLLPVVTYSSEVCTINTSWSQSLMTKVNVSLKTEDTNDHRGRDRAKRSCVLFTKDLAAYPKSSDNGFLSGIDMVFDRGSTFGRSHRSSIRSLLASCLCASSIGVVAYISWFIVVHRGLVYLWRFL